MLVHFVIRRIRQIDVIAEIDVHILVEEFFWSQISVNVILIVVITIFEVELNRRLAECVNQHAVNFLHLLKLESTHFFFSLAGFFHLADLKRIFFDFKIQNIVQFARIFADERFRHHALRHKAVLVDQSRCIGKLAAVFIAPVKLKQIFAIIVVSFSESDHLFVEHVGLFQTIIKGIVILRKFEVFNLQIFCHLLTKRIER